MWKSLRTEEIKIQKKTTTTRTTQKKMKDLSSSYYLPIHASANYFTMTLRTFMIEHAYGRALGSWISFRQCFRWFTYFWCYSVSAEQFAFTYKLNENSSINQFRLFDHCVSVMVGGGGGGGDVFEFSPEYINNTI